MSTVTIHYDSLETSITKAKLMVGKLTDYADDINRYIKQKAQNLENEEHSSYTSSVVTLAQNKINLLNQKKAALNNYQKSMRSFIDTAKLKDGAVVTEIKTASDLADATAKERNFIQAAADWIYETFCVDLVNSVGILRVFSDAMKTLSSNVEGFIRDAKNWFKYGAGKYVMKIGMSIAGTVLAVAGAIAAFVAIPFTGGASLLTIPVILGCLGFGAAAVGALISVGNTVATTVSNIKAIFLDIKGEASGARYFSSVNSISSGLSKVDHGSKKDNEAMAKKGKRIDDTKFVADIVSFAVNIANLGVARDYRVKKTANVNYRVNEGKWNQGYSFTKENVMKNIKRNMGFRYVKGENKKYTFTAKNDEAFNFMDNFFSKGTKASKYTFKGFSKNNLKSVQLMSDKSIAVIRGMNIMKNSKTVHEGINSIYTHVTSDGKNIDTYAGVVEGYFGIIGFNDLFSPFNDYGVDAGKNIGEIIGRAMAN